MAAVVELHETVAVPDVVIVFGVIAPQVRPDGTVSVSVTVPENPLTGATVIVELADCPASVGGGVVEVIAKSAGPGTVTETAAEWVSDPLLPVTVTV